MATPMTSFVIKNMDYEITGDDVYYADDMEEVILVELQNIGFNESDIFECLENDFGFKVNKIRQSR